jgi:hypothetical protein
MAVPNIPNSAINDKSKLFTHSTFLNMNIKITGSKKPYSRCSGIKGHEERNWLHTVH